MASKRRRDTIEIEVPPKVIKTVGKLELSTILPLSVNQERVFDEYRNGKQLLLHGYAGSGKSFLSLYLALDEFKYKQYKNIKIIRSVVPSRDMGFLPGTIDEKIQIFEEPYKYMVNKLYTRADAYAILTEKKVIEFCTTSFLRGLTFENSIVILDEIQNCSWQEIFTVLTRIGDNCRVILCGDYRQTDLFTRYADSGVNRLINVVQRMECFESIEFGVNDIVRGDFVKQFIIAASELEYI